MFKILLFLTIYQITWLILTFYTPMSDCKKLTKVRQTQYMPNCYSTSKSPSVTQIYRDNSYEAKAGCGGIAEDTSDVDTRYFNVSVKLNKKLKTYVKLLKVESIDIAGNSVHISLNEIISGVFKNGIFVKITFSPLMNMYKCMNEGIEQMDGFTSVIIFEKTIMKSDVDAFAKLMVKLLEHNLGKNDKIKDDFIALHRQLTGFGFTLIECHGTQTLKFDPPLG